MPVTQIKKSQAVREQVSKEEWETRVNLAACYRLMMRASTAALRRISWLTSFSISRICAAVSGSLCE